MDESDLDAAVAAGVIDAATRDRLLAFARDRRNTPDEENFRLITGFNDIFVSIACCLVFLAIFVLGFEIAPGAALAPVAAFTAATSWAMAEYFTRQRRMALPSILLLLVFVIACGGFGVSLSVKGPFESFSANLAMIFSVGGACAVVGAVAHWCRFHVPITIAAGTAAACCGVAIAIPTLLAAPVLFVPLVGVLGLLVFAEAMWFDMSDRNRATRRSDVAFWLHLLAAPMIVHPLLSPSGLLGKGNPTAFDGAITLAVFAVLTLTAVTIDRRALMVSALTYVIVALNTVFRSEIGAGGTFGLTALVIGVFLVLLSAAWGSVRSRIVSWLPRPVALRVPPAGPRGQR